MINPNIDILFWISDFDTHYEPGYKIHLIKLIIEMYTNKKLNYISKRKTLAANDIFLKK